MKWLTDYLDEVLGHVTMYRLVIYGLLAIAANALLLMVVGYLPYSPVGFLVSLALLVGVSYGANRGLGYLFGVRPHAESAIITGLILALLFSPLASLLVGVKLALVATIAQASKYILVVRGRHIFNPAAIAIVIASFFGIVGATWWIATPALLPVTIIVAFLILYRTKRLRMAGIFLAVAVTLILARTVLAGDTSMQAMLAAITSWPLVFFAGVMLSEPLTQPPRHRQQYIEAVLVGLLLALPLHVGKIVMTPALALVLGNLLGWYWSTRSAIKLRFVGKKQMGITQYDFAFDSNTPQFLPGQYMEITLPHAHADSRGVRRVFSIVGRPGDEQLNIGTKIPEKPSSFKRALMALKPGATVYGTRIVGDFVLPEDESRPMVLIAGGIGVTPYISFLMSGGKRDVSLIYAVTSPADLAYADQLRHYDVDVTIVSPEEGKLPDEAWRFIKAPRLSRDILEKTIHTEDNPLVYISGPPGMVNAVKHVVEELGLQHKTDHFTGY